MTKQKQELMTAAATFDALSVRAQHGDRRAMDTLRQALTADRPDWENSITAAVDSVRQTMLEATLRDDLVLRKAWERKAKAWQSDLKGPTPTPLERILCERVATCWLEMQVTDVGYHSRLRNQNSLTFAQSSHWQRRQDRARKRYTTACLALARARRLLKPVMTQVNIAKAGAQQMNVAATEVERVALAEVRARSRFQFADALEQIVESDTGR